MLYDTTWCVMFANLHVISLQIHIGAIICTLYFSIEQDFENYNGCVVLTEKSKTFFQ